MHIVQSKSLGDMATQAADACKNGRVDDLILNGQFAFAEVDSAFVTTFNSLAAAWQEKSKPNNLHINHGEYINRAGDGLSFLVQELRRKPDGNRSVLSLIDMDDIISSGDKPIPSFMVLQVAFTDQGFEHLQISCYFRALEVVRFLPINIAEVCYVLRQLKQDFAQIMRFELTIHAFRAYANPQFHCLEKPAIDIVSGPEITKAAMENNLDQIRSWLDSKIAYDESAVLVDGLSTLVMSIQLVRDKYPREFIEKLTEALSQLVELKKRRESSSYAADNKILSKKVRELLTEAKDCLK